MSDPYERAEQEKRRAQQPKQPKPTPTPKQRDEREKRRAQQTTKPRDRAASYRAELEAGSLQAAKAAAAAKTTKITSTTKPVVIMDLTKEINQLNTPSRGK